MKMKTQSRRKRQRDGNEWHGIRNPITILCIQRFQIIEFKTKRDQKKNLNNFTYGPFSDDFRFRFFGSEQIDEFKIAHTAIKFQTKLIYYSKLIAFNLNTQLAHWFPIYVSIIIVVYTPSHNKLWFLLPGFVSSCGVCHFFFVFAKYLKD